MADIDLQIVSLLDGYACGALEPEDVIAAVYDRVEACPDKAIWIDLVPREDALAAARSLPEARQEREALPLFGIPFAVKDNIDCAGLPTTAGCPSYAYRPTADATAVARLRAAGALLIGKTNLDQFATGLVGTRSPYGIPHSAFSKDHISGGSSSGSAVAVARGQVSFALGTDTAGSGRVPAAFNNLVGYKPTRGLNSTKGVVPACRTLDCVSVFAATCSDAAIVKRVMEGFDMLDPFSRQSSNRPLAGASFQFGVLDTASRNFLGDEGTERFYDKAIDTLCSLGGTPVEIDYTPFRKAAELLYSGPWVGERYAAVGEHIESGHKDVDPTVAQVIMSGKNMSAADAFSGQYRLAEYRRDIDQVWGHIDVLVLPTVPTTYRIEEVVKDPIKLNADLGIYTNFVNLVDCAAVAVPVGFRDGLPVGVTLIGPAFTDEGLLSLGDRLHRAAKEELMAGATGHLLAPSAPAAPQSVELAVVGAHLSGQPLNAQLTERGAKLLETTQTAPRYTLYALSNTAPPKPGLVRSPSGGAAIEVEVWALSDEAFGGFTALVPTPLAIGNVELIDGRWAKGFVCEPCALDGARDITNFGGWRAFLAASL